MKLTRYKANPILSPNESNPWEALITTNPAAWYDEDSKEVKLLYRAAGKDEEHFVYFGLAVSKDGYNFQRVCDEPVFGPSKDGFDAGCVEDPRIVKIGEYYYVTYAARPFPPGQYWLPECSPYHIPSAPDEFPVALRKNITSTGLAVTKDFKTFIRAGRITDPALDDRDVMLFPETVNGKYVLIHRPKTWDGKRIDGGAYATMCIATSDDMLSWHDSRPLIEAKYDWERKTGGCAPPLKTDCGWLTLYHAVGEDEQYRIGAMLLDLQDPAKVLHRTPDWLMQPEEDYEIHGFYNGVTFPCGNVIIDGTLFVYYGGADKYCCLATCDLRELLDHLLGCPA